MALQNRSVPRQLLYLWLVFIGLAALTWLVSGL